MRILKENVLQDYPQLKPVYDFGKRKHDATGKIRMNSGLPYWVHPDMVAEVVAAYGGTDDEIEAALGHDLIEDANVTYKDLIKAGFSEEAANIIEEVTNITHEVKRLGKEQYINKELMELSDSALFVKIADMYCNYWDHPKPGQKERLIRNLKYLIEFREKENIPRKCKRLLKGIPELEEYLDILDTNEFEDSFDDDDFEETPGTRLVSSRKIQKNKLSERRRKRRN